MFGLLYSNSARPPLLQQCSASFTRTVLGLPDMIPLVAFKPRIQAGLVPLGMLKKDMDYHSFLFVCFSAASAQNLQQLPLRFTDRARRAVLSMLKHLLFGLAYPAIRGYVVADRRAGGGRDPARRQIVAWRTRQRQRDKSIR